MPSSQPDDPLVAQVPRPSMVVRHGQWSALLGAGNVQPWKRSTVKSGHYDIVRREKGSKLLWLESAEDLNSAKSRIQQLNSFWPGEFQVMDQDSHRLVAATDTQSASDEDSAER